MPCLRKRATLFDVRQAILGHLQQGGNASPFDRIHAARPAARRIEYFPNLPESDAPPMMFIGFQKGGMKFHNSEDAPRMARYDPFAPQGSVVDVHARHRHGAFETRAEINLLERRAKPPVFIATGLAHLSFPFNLFF
jgi:hypothetical protein